MRYAVIPEIVGNSIGKLFLCNISRLFHGDNDNDDEDDDDNDDAEDDG